MVVRRNFEELYRAEEDPWQIGTADSDRYTTYVEFLRRHAPPSGFSSALDLGCGKGLSSIFLAREFGVEVWAADLWIKPTENYKRFIEAGERTGKGMDDHLRGRGLWQLDSEVGLAGLMAVQC